VSASEHNGELPGGGEQRPRRRWRWLLWVGGVLLALIVALAGLVGWVLNTESGTRWAANRAVGFLDG
jgi:autotransporter translocation and assembly factor TamB